MPHGCIFHRIKQSEVRLTLLQNEMIKQWKELIDIKCEIVELENKTRAFDFDSEDQYLTFLEEMIEWTESAVEEEGASLQEEKNNRNELLKKVEVYTSNDHHSEDS